MMLHTNQLQLFYINKKEGISILIMLICFHYHSLPNQTELFDQALMNKAIGLLHGA